jgi:hypothetical protein
VVPFVDDDESVARGKFGEVVASGEALDHRDVHDVAGSVAAAADLADLSRGEPEVGAELVSPLLDKWLAVDDHQGRGRVMRDEGTADHGLARPRRRYEHPQLGARQRLGGRGLFCAQHGLQRHVDRRDVGVSLDDGQATAGFFDDRRGLVAQSARQEKLIECLAVATDEPGRVHVENRSFSFS